MNQRDGVVRGPPRKHARRLGIYQESNISLVLGTIDGGICRWIDDQIRGEFVQARCNLLGLCEIKGCAVNRNHRSEGAKPGCKCRADLTGYAGYKDSQTLASISRQTVDIRKNRGGGVPIGDLGIGILPIDSKRGIAPPDSDLVCRTIKVVAFVEEIGRVRKNDESVREPARHIHLAAAFFIEFHRDVLSEHRAPHAYIDGDIENPAPQYGHKLGLGIRVLEMEAAQYSHAGPRQIILNEWSSYSRGCVTFGLKGFHEEAAGIAKSTRLQDKYSGQRCFESLHALHALQLGVSIRIESL